MGDAAAIPFPAAAFDIVTMSFGIRNVTDADAVLAEIRRVLAPGGRAVILEFSLPQRRLWRGLFLFYLRHIVPVIGSLIVGNRGAYRYLGDTIEEFPYDREFGRRLESAGFTQVRACPLTFGVAPIRWLIPLRFWKILEPFFQT